MKMAESSGPNYPSSIVPAGAKFDRFRRNVRNSPVSRKLDESWFLAGCLYHFAVSVCTLLSPPSSFPPPHVARYVNVILPKPLVFPIRGTSPARFFVTERISRLIDEWQEYGIHKLRRCWHMSEVSGATFCRVLLYARHPDISADRGKYSTTGCASEKEASMPPKKRISSRKYGIPVEYFRPSRAYRNLLNFKQF